MTGINFQCTNCGQPLNYAPEQAGSLQECFRCHQRLIVPGAASTGLPVPVAQAGAPPVSPSGYTANSYTQPLYQHEERSREAHVSRKLKMGAGCFAMLAVMFAVSLVGYGIGK